MGNNKIKQVSNGSAMSNEGTDGREGDNNRDVEKDDQECNKCNLQKNSQGATCFSAQTRRIKFNPIYSHITRCGYTLCRRAPDALSHTYWKV
jgi:hypothetical protein